MVIVQGHGTNGLRFSNNFGAGVWVRPREDEHAAKMWVVGIHIHSISFIDVGSAGKPPCESAHATCQNAPIACCRGRDGYSPIRDRILLQVDCGPTGSYILSGIDRTHFGFACLGLRGGR